MHGDVFKLHILSEQQTKIQQYFIQNDIKQRKATDVTFKKLEPASFWHFWLI